MKDDCGKEYDFCFTCMRKIKNKPLYEHIGHKTFLGLFGL